MAERQILHVITRSEWGGAPRVVQSLATGVDAATVVACGPGGRLIDRIKDDGVPVKIQPHLQSPPGPRDVLAYRDLYRFVQTSEFDIVHCHSTKAGVLGRIAAVTADIPTVFTVHGWGFYNTEYSLLRPALVRAERALATRTDAVVCVSESDRLQGQKHDIFGKDDGHVIHNGIEPLHEPMERTRLHNEIGIDADVPMIGAIARLAPQKNPLAILETAQRLQERDCDFATVLIGSGPLADECRSFIDQHNLENVHLLGFRDDAMELLFDFDVFLLPSRFEGFPLTVLECLHAGVPVVAHDVGGVGEAIDDSITGFVVAPEDDGMFTDRVECLLHNAKKRERMGQRSRQVANARFTAKKMVQRYQELYARFV